MTETKFSGARLGRQFMTPFTQIHRGQVGTGETVVFVPSGQANTWTAELADGQKLTLSVNADPNSATGKTLRFTHVGDASSITVRNFNLNKATAPEGYLGIQLDNTPKLALQQGSGKNPFGDTSFNPASMAAFRTNQLIVLSITKELRHEPLHPSRSPACNFLGLDGHCLQQHKQHPPRPESAGNGQGGKNLL